MIPPVIHQRFLNPYGVQQVTPMTAGMSGSKVYRCDGERTFVLRRHADSISIDRVREIHAIMAPAADRCDMLPAFIRDSMHHQTIVVGDRKDIWEFVEWKPGGPLGHDATLEQIRSGAVAIGNVHRAMAAPKLFGSLGQAISSPHAVPPSVIERIDRIKRLNESLAYTLSRDIQGHVDPAVLNPVRDAQRLLAKRWAAVSSQMSTRLQQIQQTAFPLQYVLRDVHRDHILYRGGQVTAVIDFDALRIDTPAADLARWISGFEVFLRNRDQVVDAVLAGYFGVQPLSDTVEQRETAARIGEDVEIDLGKITDSSPDFRKLVILIAESSTWISLANWVNWLIAESRQFADLQRVAERLSRLIETAEAL